MTIYRSSSSAATKKLGRELARKITVKKSDGAVVVALLGELGAGKTTFAQGFAAGLGVREKISSPTFILMRVTETKGAFKRFVHIDAYRADAEDFSKLGFKKIAADANNVILVEWAERLKKILPKDTIKIKFSHGKKENEREIKLHR